MGLRIIRIILLSILIPSVLWALPAFPGAEGMGASATGGRGGTVYVVDTLSDNPDDGVTFREACVASGARIIVFSVSGTINLLTTLTVSNDNLTIAGQTSPGGICISGASFILSQVENVIITHMRFRKGSHIGDADTARSIEINGTQNNTDPAHNIIIDHCSFSWGPDTNVSINYTVYDVTFSWCMITWGLQDPHSESNHGLGTQIWGRYTQTYNTVPYGITMHHCFHGYNYYRLPELTFAGFMDLTNNVSYYWHSTYAPYLQPMNDSGTNKLCYANMKHCYADVRSGEGNDQDSSRSAILYPSSVTAYQAIYMTGCLSGARTSQGASQWDVGQYDSGGGWGLNLISTNWQSGTEFEVRDIPVTATTMSSEYAATVVAGCGANRISSTTEVTRDAVDASALSNYIAGTGAYEADVTYPDDWPTFSTSSDNPTDSDSDGMWDATELIVFGSLSKDGTADTDGDGYLDIEEYLFYLGGYQESSPSRGVSLHSVDMH